MKQTKLPKNQAIHYVGFFGLYFLAVYLLLYHSNDLSPFQKNFHFFSNAFGSLSKRYLGDILPYVVFLLVLYYSKRTWLRFIALVLLYGLLLLNLSAVVYYNLIQSNAQLYQLQAFKWPIFKSYFGWELTALTIFLIATGLYFGYFFFRHPKKGKRKDFLMKRKRLVAAFFVIAVLLTYVIPSRYDLHETVAIEERVGKKTIRLMELESSGAELLIKELFYHFAPRRVKELATSEEEMSLIEAMGLDSKSTQNFKKIPKKIILIVAESLNQSFTSFYNNNLDSTTPFLDSLMASSGRVDEFYPSGPFTIHGLSAMFCGHTNLKYGTSYPEHKCAPELMAELGYRTEMVRGFSKYYIGENVTFDKFGFDTITGREDLSLKYPEFRETFPWHYETWGFTDNFLFDEVLERLRNADDEERLFISVLGVDTHIPGGRCYDGDDRPEQNEPILYSVHCFDDYLKGFMEKADAEGLLDDETVVMLTSDQLYPAFTTIPGNHFLTSFRLRPDKIPFLMVSEGPYELRAKRGSQVDIASTLLDLVNIPEPPYYLGRSLLSNTESFPVGQDRTNGFVIIGDTFYHTSLLARELSDDHMAKAGENGTVGFGVKLASGTVEELETYIDVRKAELEQGSFKDFLIQKWYYNNYFYHELTN